MSGNHSFRADCQSLIAQKILIGLMGPSTKRFETKGLHQFFQRL
ncbi:hypothetical protein HMPREF0322_02437 [Desulfitobacterium hafniense DP7]|uniref:Uncharacterized protein n=1 Tax=Desulfitobacterium hafniense DP7 TaxID=537010 RepID=G9XN96_DESHA|nr:hypothetical protein HMPREF0322_02437 [Desulfitobacterium hafniense DP7]